MPRFIYNIEQTVIVTANTKQEADDLVYDGDYEVDEQDIMFVEQERDR